jgi:Ion channel
LVLLLLLIVGASYMADRKIVRIVVVPLTAIWLLARALEAFGDGRQIYAHLAPVAGLALSCAILWAIVARIDRVPRVTSSVIAEAFISYLVLAIAFSQLFWILNRTLARPFNQVIPSNDSSTLLYFSMITLTSVGYGGIVPVDPYVRLVAALESMFGIFYIAVVVARLVSSYRPARDRRGDEPDPPVAP